MAHRSLWLITVLLLFSMPGLAQDETPTPTAPPLPEPVVTFDTHFLYPAALHVNLSMELPVSQIEIAVLVIEPGTNAQTSIVIDLEEDITIGDPFTVFDFVWLIPPENPPEFLSIVDYQMQIVLENGRNIILDDEFIFADPEIDWQRDDDPEGRFDFLYPADTVDVPRLRDDLNDAYGLLADNTGRTVDFRLALFDDEHPLDPCGDAPAETTTLVSDINGREVECPGGIVSEAVENLGYELFEVGSLRSGTTATITQALIERFYAPLWRNGDVPVWVQAGITEFYLYGSSANVEFARTLVRNQNSYSLDELNNPNDDNRQQAQAYTMLLYVADQAGLDAVYTLARGSVEEGETFEETYARVVGQPLEALIPSWRNWIFRQSALDAASINVYAGPTASPTPSATATPFPPSPTFTPTNTPTATPTPTVTGVLSATPLPSLTPSFTPVPNTASPTPRSAMAAFAEATTLAGTAQAARATPTPSVEPASDGEIPLEIAVPVLGGIFTLLLIAIVILIRRTR